MSQKGAGRLKGPTPSVKVQKTPGVPKPNVGKSATAKAAVRPPRPKKA